MGIKLSEEQIQAYKHIITAVTKERTNPICALGMGMGKTLVACQIINSLKLPNPKVLIIIKPILFSETWEPHLLKYLNNNKLIYLHGNDRHQYKKNKKYYFPDSSIILTTYETLRTDITNGCYELSEVFDLIIYDEIHTIINSMKLTKSLSALSKLKSRIKLALTGTPMNNYTLELGLIYIFLNDLNAFYEWEIIHKSRKRIANKQNKLRTILEKGFNDCINKNAIFRLFLYTGNFIRTARTVSIPISNEMNKELILSGNKITPRKRRYLSHPGVLKTNIAINDLPRCTKIEAVKLIIQSTLEDEKVIIFSSYVPVLDAYFYTLKDMGYDSVRIISKDKNEKLKVKLDSFRYLNKKILLTTLPKSSEGLNLDIATHVIILEFWWNPQKLFQAGGRVDRKSQERNIFFYILCYNHNGIIIDIENKYFEIILNKIIKINSAYEEIDKKCYSKNENQLSSNYELPEIISFTNIDTFNNDFSKYLAKFQHTPLKSKKIFDDSGFPLSEVKSNIKAYTEFYLKLYETVENTPWIINKKNSYLSHYCIDKLTLKKDILINKIDIWGTIKDCNSSNLESNFQVIHYERVFYKIKLFNGEFLKLSFGYLIGKKNDGKYNLIGIYNQTDIFENIKKRGVKNIQLIITNSSSLNERLKYTIQNYFRQPLFSICMSYIFNRITYKIIPNSNDFKLINNIFSTSSYIEAVQICEKACTSDYLNIEIFKNLNSVLRFASNSYEYEPTYRKIVCTNNIIFYLVTYMKILIGKKLFISEEDAFSYILLNSQKILENGDSFIPNWDFLCKKI